ncbi:DUF680 domain-containing protein [Mesorhizobium tamadayense]|uniref:DUF680 domain-containing protein n=1 Tax=Mesorhizobium tamadayense TaxID=425306 RepID=A0A3P3EXG2_9HYPH|nr:DUF680 domain-containing protein [Mesorhizobium tamadayense]RRH90961.1 DUF680 domain-containing protein [Mesorhizobium tamadayense]
MKKIALTAAAILVATSSAFAGSDHYGSNNANQPVANVDNSYTASIRKPAMAQHKLKLTTKSDADEPGQGIWGN